jgi:Fe2+ transport system protein B
MIPILPLLDPLARLAAAAMEHVNIRKARLTSKDKEAQAQRLKELEESDLEQARMISELSENVERLAKAVQSEIEENKLREARLRRWVYAALVVGLVSIAISLAMLFK